MPKIDAKKAVENEVLGARSAPLGITTKSTSPPTFETKTKEEKSLYSDSQKVIRYALLAVARSILAETVIGKNGYFDPVWRIANCRKRLNFRKSEFEIHTSYDDAGQWKAWLGGVCICGSVHVCAVDAFTIGQKRGKELTAAIQAKGCGQAFLVVTARHHRNSDASELYKLLQGGLSHAMSGAPYQRFAEKWDIKGTVTGWDYTCSIENGHHPHKNILFLSGLPTLDNPEFENDLEKIAARFESFLTKRGIYVNSHTTKVLTDKKDCANYMTKWALSLEVSQGSRKEAKEGHFTQFELLHEIGFADLDDRTKVEYIKLFREFAYASKGKRQLRYSEDLRDWLKLGQEKTDEELAQEGEDPSWILTTLTIDQWRPILAKEKSGAIGRMLIVARDAQGDPAPLWDYLAATYGIRGSDAQRNPLPAVMFVNDHDAG